MRLLATASIVSFLALAGPVSAQMYPMYSSAPQPAYSYYSSYSAVWPEMMDNGSSSDFPTHTATDFVADQLNRQVLEYNAQPPVYPMPMYLPR